MKCEILFWSVINIFTNEHSFIFFGTALVIYNPEFLKELENKLKKKSYFKNNYLLAFIIFLSGCFHIWISYNLEFIAHRTFFRLNRIDGNFSFLFNSINQSIKPFIMYHYGYMLIFISIFFLIIPVINGTYKFYFKKIFILAIFLFYISFFFLIYSTTLETLMFNRWAEYFFSNYFSDAYSITWASTFLILNFVFLWFATFLVGLIFIYNIFFKRAKGLSIFLVLRSFFLIILATFILTFQLAHIYLLLAGLLLSYNIRYALAAWGNYSYFDNFWSYDNIFSYFYNPVECFHIISALAVIQFIFKEQSKLKISSFSYEFFFRYYTKIWFIMVISFYFLTTVLKYNFVYLSISARINLRFAILLTIFFLFIYFLLKNFYLENLNPVFISIFVFMTFFMILIVFIFLIYSYSLTPDEKGLRFYKPFYHFINLFILWSIIAFFHQILEYYIDVELNFKLIITEFFFLILGSLVVFWYSLGYFYEYFFSGRLFMGYSKIPVASYERFVSVQNYLCEWGYDLIFSGFFLVIIWVFLSFVINSFKK
jgi:hypothetical protein